MKAGMSEPWYRTATLYHIYPLSFADSNGDGLGDLRGILGRLDYLNDGTAESLGVGAIWLSPVYASAMVDGGYDITDHLAIDPRFGTMDDFDRLLEAVHKRGMRLLMDYVPNHTSNLHPWFVDSRSSRQSAKRDWYIWADPARDGGPPNNWLSHFGGPAWTLDEATGQYYMHTFLAEEPDLNWRNPAVRESMLEVLKFWLKKGVDGFRTDAVMSLLKDEQLRDDVPNPDFDAQTMLPAQRLKRVHSQAIQELNPVVGSFCAVIADYDESYMLSEAYLNIPDLQRLYRACREHPVHAPFNFNLMTLEWSAQTFREFIDEYEAMMGPEDWPNYVLGNHDRHRLVSRVGSERARLLGLLQLTLRGLPVVYYGDELGLPDGQMRTGEMQDASAATALAPSRDSSRMPMPWNTENGVGFTTGKPWLPIGPAMRRLSVVIQEGDPNSTLHLYRHLIHLRRSCPALTTGDYRSVDLGEEGIFAYIRETELQRFLVVLNFASRAVTVGLNGPVGVWIAGTHVVDGDGEPPEGPFVHLKAYEGRVYELRRGGFNGPSI